MYQPKELECEDCKKVKPDAHVRGDTDSIICDSCMDNYENITGYCSANCRISSSCDGSC